MVPQNTKAATYVAAFVFFSELHAERYRTDQNGNGTGSPPPLKLRAGNAGVTTVLGGPDLHYYHFVA